MSSTVDLLDDDAASERVRYYPRQLLTAEDMTAEQRYLLERLRRHNRLLHGWGVVAGCDVRPASGGPWRVAVSPGYLVTPRGDEVFISAQAFCDLAQGGGAGQTVYLAARYAERDSRPLPASAGGGACDNGDCEFTRILDGFELAALTALPASHTQAAAADQHWCNALRAWAGGNNPMPVPPLVLSDEPWVVLATIHLPSETDAALGVDAISYAGRRTLYSASALRQFATCLGSAPPTSAPPTTPPPTTPPTTPPPTTPPPTTAPPTTPPTTPPPTTAPPATTPPPTAPPVALTNFTISSSWDQDNWHHYFGHVTLGGTAPAGGALVSITCNDPSVVTGPDSVVVPQGQTTTDFEFSIGFVNEQAQVIITASRGGVEISRNETIRLEPAGETKF